MAWYRIFRSQREAQKVHPDLGLSTCRANVCALYSLTAHPFAISIFLRDFNCQADWCNFQSSHHSGCIITDNAFSLGALSRGAKSLSSFSSMIVTKQKCWARAQIFPWTSMVPCNHLPSHAPLSTCVTMSSCIADFLWAITMETRILQVGPVEHNLSKATAQLTLWYQLVLSVSGHQWGSARTFCVLTPTLCCFL